MDRNKILPGGTGASTTAWRRPPSLRITVTTGCVIVVIAELLVHLSSAFHVFSLAGWSFALLLVGSVTFFRHQMSRAKSPSADGSLLIAETEAFLSGDLVSYLRSRRRGVPAWTWLNSFAHGELPTLRETQRSTHVLVSARHVGEKSWFQAQSILGRDLLSIVQDDPKRLMLVQKSILVPLELQLMELDANAGLTAYELVQATRAALRPIP
jgi:hypothetical protein